MPQTPAWRSAWLTLVVLLLAVPVWGQNPNVTVDDQPTAEERLEEVLELRRAQRYAEAAELVQELIESAAYKLVSVGEGGYADAGQWGRDLLFVDGELRQAYTERYNAAAARALEQANASQDRLLELLGVHRRYSATPSGLEAALTAAGLLLESGQMQSAGLLVEPLMRHPDREAYLPRLLMLRGASAAYRQDRVALEEAAEDLTALDAQASQALAALASSIEPAAVAARSIDADMGPKPMSIRAPLWDRALAGVEDASRWLLDDRASVPVVTPATVLVNNGRQVVALDRASGQRVWAYPADDDHEVTKNITAQRWLDQRSVARSQGRLVAVLGECHGISQRRNPYVPMNHLVCIDEQTGKGLWHRESSVFRFNEPRQSPDRRVGGPNLQHTHFVGTPLISHGKVFVVMRRANSEGDTQSSWLMAYDAADGGLLWYRHLALVSLSYTNADSMRVGPRLLLDGDTVYMSDALGTVGAIDVHTGGYRWLRILPVGSESSKSIVANTRGVGSAPVLTEAGLLVPLSMTSDRLVLVDPADGSVLRSFKQDPVLSKTQYLLETHSGVLAVSQTAVSHWDADQAQVRWTFTLGAGEVMRGPGAVSLNYAVLPTSQRLIVLSLADGELIEDAPVVKGAVVLHDGEVLAVSEGRLHAYTKWERVYRRLVEQVERHPDDPSAGLSLASIAIRQQGEADSVLLGVEHALDAVSRQPVRRRAAVASHVFEQLRLLIPQVDEAALRHALYDRLALVTQTAAHEAAYHLDAGVYFASQGDTLRAVDHLHAVIAEPAFASATYTLDGVARPAGTLAQQHLEALIQRYGRGVYARQDAMAQASIDALKAEGDLNAAALASIARRYPLSPLAGELLLEAAQAREAEDRWIAAAGLYKQALQRAVGDDQRRAIAGHLIVFYLKTQRPTIAAEFLDRFTAQHAGLLPTHDGQTVSLDQWRQRIADTELPQASVDPLASALASPVLIDGVLVGGLPGARPQAPTRVYLRHNDDTLTCRLPESLGEALWRADVPEGTGALLLLADENGQVLFWSAGASRVLAFDRASGEALWQATLVFHADKDAAKPAEQAGFIGPDLLVAVSETVVCFGHRESAEVVALDRASGLLLWRTTLEMTALTALDTDNWSLVAAGRAGHAQQLRSGKLAVLSLTDGQPLLEQGLLRVGVTPFAVELDQQRAIVLGPTGVMAFDLASGASLWSRRLPNKRLTGTHAFSAQSQRLAVETSDGEVHLFDTGEQGRAIGAVTVRGGGDLFPVGLQSVDGVIWCRSPRGVFKFGSSAVPDWADAIQADGAEALRLVVGEAHVGLVTRPDDGDADNGLTLFMLESKGGRLVEQYAIGPLAAPARGDRAVRFGRGLAIPVGEQTLVIPPAE